ncbi:MAG: hypothetical protein ACRDQ4_08950 [Pseudonocardiaceae bacterium]
MPAEQRSLARIAENSGFLMSDVAFLAGLEGSTVSRLWDDPQWLDRVTGKSLQAIVSVLPGVGEYVVGFSLADRRSRLVEDLARSGVHVNPAVFRRLVQQKHVPEQYLSNALEAAIGILGGDAGGAAALLARFWGRDRDFALGLLFDTSVTSGLLNDVAVLVTASIDMIGQLNTRKNSFHAIIAQANLMHHVVRVTGDVPDEGASVAALIRRHSALIFRSTAIGRIMATDDLELSERYCREVASSPLLSIVEGWAFPTFTHDARVTSDFSLPRSLVLRHTASEILREVEQYNDAYLFYLAETSIPTVMRRDPTFGARLLQLTRALRTRLERCVEPAARNACERILRMVENDAPSDGWRESREYAW